MISVAVKDKRAWQTKTPVDPAMTPRCACRLFGCRKIYVEVEERTNVEGAIRSWQAQQARQDPTTPLAHVYLSDRWYGFQCCGGQFARRHRWRDRTSPPSVTEKEGWLDEWFEGGILSPRKQTGRPLMEFIMSSEVGKDLGYKMPKNYISWDSPSSQAHLHRCSSLH